MRVLDQKCVACGTLGSNAFTYLAVCLFHGSLPVTEYSYLGDNSSLYSLFFFSSPLSFFISHLLVSPVLLATVVFSARVPHAAGADETVSFLS